jgi:hypothetical protein
MASNQQILSDLRLIMDAGHSLELLSTYKGVPVICKAKIQRIGDDIVQLQAEGPALVCLAKEKQIRVLGSDYFEPSLAQIVSIDIPTGKLELADFGYLGTKLGERMIVRVEPKSPVHVTLINGGQITVGRLVDLSINGMGVRIGYADYNPSLKPGTNVQIRAALSTGEIEVNGVILSVVRSNEYYRLSLRFSQNGTQKSIIFKFLVDRRAEIEVELQKDYQAALETKESIP